MPSTQQQNNYEQYQAYSQLLDRNGQWIGVADTKAGAILAFIVIAFPLFAAPALPLLQKSVQTVFAHETLWHSLSAVILLALVAMFFGTALLTLALVLMTLSPRLTRQGKSGLIFFGDIARQQYHQWQQDMFELDVDKLTQQVVEQIYATACIAHHKHVLVRRAIHALFFVLFSGLALYVFSQLMN